MKKLILAIVLFTTVITTSCKKTVCPTPVVPIDLSGTIFKGTITFDGLGTYENTSLKFNGDGTVEYTFIGQPVYKGTWGKSPNSSLVNIVYSPESSTKWNGTGKVNVDGTKIETGVLTQVLGGSGTGSFSLVKQ
jgi:hypothetical protein